MITSAQTDKLRHLGKRAQQIIIDNGGRRTGREDDLKALVVEAMQQLGTTPDDVAALLVELRCTGAEPYEMGDPDEASLSAEDNPLAAYLVAQCGFAGVMLTSPCCNETGEDYKLDVAWPGTGFDPECPGFDDYTMGLAVPEPVGQVLRAFALGKLPHLVRTDDEPYPVWLESPVA